MAASGFWLTEKPVRSNDCGWARRWREQHLRALLKEVYAQAGVTGGAGGIGRRGQRQPSGDCGVDRRDFSGEFNIERSEVVGDEVIALDAAFRGGRESCRSRERAPTP